VLAKSTRKAITKQQTKSEDQLTWKELEIGSIATKPGNASQYRTGDWSSRHPVYDYSKCIKCGLCQVFCPEGCIKTADEGFFAADLYYCKGCGICAKECPKKVITMVEEKE
jgi:pyruvate ferredoxin oxidoreductase delta subunit